MMHGKYDACLIKYEMDWWSFGQRYGLVDGLITLGCTPLNKLSIKIDANLVHGDNILIIFKINTSISFQKH